jgi:hypothetical protein
MKMNKGDSVLHETFDTVILFHVLVVESTTYNFGARVAQSV